MPMQLQSRCEEIDSVAYNQSLTPEIFPQPFYNTINRDCDTEEYSTGNDLVAPIPIHESQNIFSGRSPFYETSILSQTYTSIKNQKSTSPRADLPVYTLEDAYEAVGIGKLNLMLLLFCGTGYALASSYVIFIGTLLPHISSYYNYKPLILALLPSFSLAFTYLGSWFWSNLADIRGRRPIMIMCPLLYTVFGLLCCLAPNFPVLVITSSLQGFSIGGCLKVDLVYYLETLPKSFRRSHMLTFYIYGFALGALYPSLCSYLIFSTAGWKFYYLANSFLSFVLFIVRLIWTFESPFYMLYFNHSISRAYRVLFMLSSMNRTLLPHGQLTILPSDDNEVDSVLLDKLITACKIEPFYDKDPLLDASIYLSIYWFFVCFANSSWVVWIPNLLNNFELSPSFLYLVLSLSFTLPVIALNIHKVTKKFIIVKNPIHESLKPYIQLLGLIVISSAGFFILAFCVNEMQCLFSFCFLGASWSFFWIINLTNLEKIFLFPIEHCQNLMKRKQQKLWWFRQIQPHTVCQAFGTALGPLCSAALFDSVRYHFASRVVLYSISIVLCISIVPLLFFLFNVIRSK